MKKILLFVLFILLLGVSFSETYSVYSHLINIQVNTDGFVTINEKFSIYFPTEQDKVNFRETSTNLGSDIAKWENFNPKFTPTIGANNLTSGIISYTEGKSNFLELTYELLDPLMEKGKETNMVIEYSLKASYLNALFEPPFWVIPDGTDLIIELPPGASVKGTVEPKAETVSSGTKQLVIWKGYKSGSRLEMNYILWKKSDPVVDINALSNFLFKTREGLLTIVIGIIIILILIWKRKKIVNRIESFVEKHTLIEEI